MKPVKSLEFDPSGFDEADVAIIKIKSQEFLRHIEEIEKLPEKDQQVLTSLLDAYIKKYKFEQLAHA